MDVEDPTPDGSREINQLHVPVGQPVSVILASEDVIHSFYVPAFRVKMDVVPGRYTAIWFEATREGEFHLFCAEYCGTQHSGMIGRVVAMKPIDYQRWLSSQASEDPMTCSGERLFQQLGCGTCHQTTSTGKGPRLTGIVRTSGKARIRPDRCWPTRPICGNRSSTPHPRSSPDTGPSCRRIRGS